MSSIIYLDEYRHGGAQHRQPGQRDSNAALSSVATMRNRVAMGLRAFQAERTWQGEAFDPWAICPFVQVAGPALPAKSQLAPLVVLNDALEGVVFGQLQMAGWGSAEALMRESRAYVFCAPSGRAVLTLQSYEGTPLLCELTLRGDLLHLLQLEQRGRGRREHLQVRPI